MSSYRSSHDLPSNALDSMFILYTNHFPNGYPGSCNLSSKWVFYAKEILLFTSSCFSVAGYELLLNTWWVTLILWWGVRLSRALGSLPLLEPPEIHLFLHDFMQYSILWYNIIAINIILICRTVKWGKLKVDSETQS